MSLKTRLISVVVLICFLMGVVYFGYMDFNATEEEKAALIAPKETVRLWYTDDALTDYLNSVALEYYEKTDVRIKLILVSGREYLEEINEASLNSSEIPDMYIVGNDSLGKAYLAGLASEIGNKKNTVSTSTYPQTALDAVTYDGMYVAYPFYFETSYLLYNKTYLESIARTSLQEEMGIEPAEDVVSEDAVSENTTDDAFEASVLAKSEELVPETIEDILILADAYDAPENVESIFKWDVSDIFYNYFFVGNYLNVGGNTGDQEDQIDIYNEKAINSLHVYQQLNQFFSINAEEVNYESVLQEFLAGKTIFTVATTNAIDVLEQAKQNGEFAFEYGVSTIPNITADLESKGMSVTSSVVINGYSDKKKQANEFAKYLTYDYADQLYDRSGKVASKLGVNYEYPALATVIEEYARSTSMPKMLETSNFWIQLEICFTKAWSGNDVNTLLLELSEKMKTQLTGQEYKEVYVETPVTNLMTEEFLDDTESTDITESTEQ